MNLRIARKILKAIGTPRESAYNEFQVGKAVDRVEKTRTAREDRWYFEGLLPAFSRIGEGDELIPLDDPQILSDEDHRALADLGEDLVARLIASRS